jgi:sialic acid synthase SpsE
LNEVLQATRVLREGGCQDLTLLHCVSGYPAAPDECNLSCIETLREACGVSVGWSDHTVNPGVVSRAVHRWGATMVEFHLDLDQQGEEYHAGHCWLPEQIAPVIQNVGNGFIADGLGEKKPTASEVDECQWRADPVDGLRPLQGMREAWKQPITA